MKQQMRIDFVSDVSCPWCAIGLKSLQQALQRVAGEISADIHFQPFELNPGMGAEGHTASLFPNSPALDEQRRWVCAVEVPADPSSRLTLTLDMRGLLIPVVALFYKGLTNRYMTVEAQGMKRAAESG